MKFYKIIGPKCRNDLIHKEGVNTDPIPFKPSGSCEEGGIYFSREDILGFLGYGTELYEVEPIGEVYEDPQTGTKKWKAHSVNLTYVGKVWDNIQYLVEQGADIHANISYALHWAAEHGNLEVVKYLIEQGADILDWRGWGEHWVTNKGQFEVAQYLRAKT